MTFYNHLVRHAAVVAGIALLLVSALVASGQTALTSRSHLSSSSGDEVFNLSDFGAVGNGVADDGPAFQRALDAVVSAGGGTLFVPAGHYLIATPVAKDFTGVASGVVRIQGVPSLTMPAPPTASGQELSLGLNLTSHIIPATGQSQNAITLSNLHQFLIEHIDFAGRPSEATDAFITLILSDIDEAIIRHCEFYGVSSLAGGNVVRAVRSALSIELSVFLGCTANSGVYAPVVENHEWRRFAISNSIFLDYGQRPFFGKTGLGSPLSWINVGSAALPTPESPRREIVVRDTFLDEGGWVGISVFPHRFPIPKGPIDLLFISGLKMNVPNFGTSGHAIYEVRNILIEKSHYGWSHNASSAISINRSGHAIFDNLTCINHADVLHADSTTQRLTVINSTYREIQSLAQTTTVIQTTPDLDPVQFVRSQFMSALGREPDPAAHFYWSDKLVRCGEDNECLTQQRSSLSQYLANAPQTEFSLAGTVLDENGSPIVGATVNLTGSQVVATSSDSQGNFRFSNLPTSGTYTVAATKSLYTFNNQTFFHPAGNLNVTIAGRLNRYTISGRITRSDGSGIGGVTVSVQQSPTTSATTDSSGNYVLPDLATGGTYTVVPVSTDFGFIPASRTFQNLSANQQASFVGRLRPKLMTIEGSDIAVALNSVTFAAEPFSLFDSIRFSLDGITRLTIFAKDLEASDASQISVVAEDQQGSTYPLGLEYMGVVADQSWLKQLNIKLSSNLPKGGYIHIRLAVADLNSNRARIYIAP